MQQLPQQRNALCVHISAKTILVTIFSSKQRLWDGRFRFGQTGSAINEEGDAIIFIPFYSHRIVATELLVKTIDTNVKNILPKGFEKELIPSVDSRVRTNRNTAQHYKPRLITGQLHVPQTFAHEPSFVDPLQLFFFASSYLVVLFIVILKQKVSVLSSYQIKVSIHVDFLR